MSRDDTKAHGAALVCRDADAAWALVDRYRDAGFYPWPMVHLDGGELCAVMCGCCAIRAAEDWWYEGAEALCRECADGMDAEELAAHVAVAGIMDRIRAASAWEEDR